MGHGDRWAAVTGDSKNAVEHYLPLVTSKGVVVAGAKRRFLWPEDHGSPQRSIVTSPIGFFLSEGSLGFCAISLALPDEKRLALMTAYPVPVHGLVRPLVIVDVKETCLGLEGWIDAETEEGVPISFFAADYFAHPERYFKNAVVELALSGIVYVMRIANPTDIVITVPATIQRYRDEGMDIPPGEPIRISMANAAFMLPLEGWEPFDYSFQGVVKNIERVAHGSRSLFRMGVTVTRGGGRDVDVALLAQERILDGFQPTAGSIVAGRMCIMGWVADFKWPVANT